MHFGCISGRVLRCSALFFSGDLAALVYIDENRLLKRLDSGDLVLGLRQLIESKASSGESLSCLDFISLSPGLIRSGT
jgi:hypothetical protein